MTCTEEAILGAIITEPAEDLHRLAYADWLEEHGDDARAEFVRAQCAYPGWFGALPGPSDPLPGAVARAWDLLHGGVADAWLGGMPGAPFGPGRAGTPCWERASRGGDISVRFRRGFVSEVTLPCAAWEGHGPALVRAAPVERVTLTGKQPFMHHWARYPGGAELSYEIPPGIYRNLRGRSPALVKPYRDDAAALDALSEACLAWARAAGKGGSPAAAGGGA
jgi:uncharacterized protein (TIGR02996 family)